jgi:pantoate--beta-alanine ligase
MLLFNSVAELRAHLDTLNGSLGFVPTMGALHKGHISLIKQSIKDNKHTICSIFVNPTQFNDKSDLDRYPRTLEKDLDLLKEAGCELVFVPSVLEIYPDANEPSPQFNFENLDKVMEGKFRPGHFQGVAMVVKRLFEIVRPTRAYFGKKDFQQLAIIKRLKELLDLPVEVIGCETLRESDGLAMSSRNQLLSDKERVSAGKISQALRSAREMAGKTAIPELEEWVMNELKKDPVLDPEYFSVVVADTLEAATSWNDRKPLVGCVAVKAGKIRLIDNMVLIP